MNNNDGNVDRNNSSSPTARRRSPWIKKPIWALDQYEHEMQTRSPSTPVTQLSVDSGIEEPLLAGEEQPQPHQVSAIQPHLSLFDLITLGVGITIGAGIFVLSSVIAHKFAGPATVVSWGLSGFAAFLSAMCYAEISGRIPSSGSAYAYAFASMGEFPAFVTACCLFLEYLVTGSAVARSWGSKFCDWVAVELHGGNKVHDILNPGYGINIMAVVIVLISTLIVFWGVKESKAVTTVMTWCKVALVTFMTIGGLILFRPKNMTPFVPPEFGVKGIALGATKAFFAFMGYDAICCVAGEAKDSRRNVPRAIMATVTIVSVLYITATVALTGMQYYTNINPTRGFAGAFDSNGWYWAGQIVSAGEVALLPLVVLASMMIQPRVQYALAKDGLVPSFLKDTDKNGNPVKGIWFAGGIMGTMAAFLPFNSLNDFVSCGYLFSFNVTNSALLLMKFESPPASPMLLPFLIALFQPLALGSALVFAHLDMNILGITLATLLTAGMIAVVFVIYFKCPKATVFGGRSMGIPDDGTFTFYEAPLMPFLGCASTYVNWTLVAQLSTEGLGIFFAYIFVAVIFYFAYSIRHSTANTYGFHRPDTTMTVAVTSTTPYDKDSATSPQ